MNWIPGLNKRMNINDEFWKRKSLKYLKRQVNNRGYPKDVFLIVCEGEKTEPNYFRSFRVPKEIRLVTGCGDNTKNLVLIAKKYVEDAAKKGIKYDQTWCVFDKNSFPKEHFNSALALAKKSKIEVAYSNEAFELWYLLHFDYIVTAISRKDYTHMLSERLGMRYEKNCKTMYNVLLNKQKTAIKNAERLLSLYEKNDPYENNPSTTVHLLVKELNKFLDSNC